MLLQLKVCYFVQTNEMYTDAPKNWLVLQSAL